MKVAIPLLFFSLIQLASAALVRFTLKLTVAEQAPDGIPRKVYFVNGQTPGPELVVTQGDQVEVTVINYLDVALTIHFHGIAQQGTPWTDGVPGVTQRPIDPGNQFIHNFTVFDHGSYWYHAHNKDYYGDGVRGAFRVIPSASTLAENPFSLISNDTTDIQLMTAAHLKPQTMSLFDWQHFTSDYQLAEWQATQIEIVCIDSVLINGKGRVICPPESTFAPYTANNPLVPAVTAKGCGFPNNTLLQPFQGSKPDAVPRSIFFDCTNSTTPLEVIQVDSQAKWASLTLISMSTLYDFKFSIDNHTIWVYAADGQYHEPQEVNVLLAGAGERYTVMVKLDKPIADYAIRVAVSAVPQLISGYGVFSYRKTETTGAVIPSPMNQALGYGGDTLTGFTELNATTLVPFPSTIKPPQESNVTLIFGLQRLSAVQWALNVEPFAQFLHMIEPLVFDPAEAESLAQDLVPYYPAGSVVDIIFQSSPGNPDHPIHKHGVKAFVIGGGQGSFTWANVSEAIKAQPGSFNLVNPPLRDGFLTLPAITTPSWTVIRYQVAGPGISFLHCHIGTHLSSGMAVALMEGVNATSPLSVPNYYVQWDEQAARSQGTKRIRRAGEQVANGVGSGSLLPRIVRPIG